MMEPHAFDDLNDRLRSHQELIEGLAKVWRRQGEINDTTATAIERLDTTQARIETLLVFFRLCSWESSQEHPTSPCRGHAPLSSAPRLDHVLLDGCLEGADCNGPYDYSHHNRHHRHQTVTVGRGRLTKSSAPQHAEVRFAPVSPPLCRVRGA
jgi:hypothetical protein